MGLPHIAAMSTHQGDKRPWDKKSNRLFSVLEIDNDQSRVQPPTFAEKPEVPFTTYYTLDKLTNVRDYTELNRAVQGSPMAGEMRSSMNGSLINLDGQSKSNTPVRLRSIDQDNPRQEIFNDSIFRPSMVGLNKDIQPLVINNIQAESKTFSQQSLHQM